MAGITSLFHSAAEPVRPAVRRITVADLREALREGVDDFRAAPTQLLLLGVVYSVIGLIAARLAYGADLLPMVYPLVAGLALMGPFVTAGVCDLSRRRDQGLPVSWVHVFDVFRSPARGAVLELGAILLAIFMLWLGVAAGIYRLTLGGSTASEFLARLFTTPQGWALVVFGNLAGLLFAAGVLMLTVVSFPLMIDRGVDPVTAMRTSVRAVLANPGPMAAWGAIVALALALGSIPLFVGLAVVVPILGHATWRLYRKVVV